MRLDLHVHSVRSPDSALRLADIIDLLGVHGLQGFALTDHNTIDGHSALREVAARFPQYRFIPGVEVSTEEGHLLVYGCSELPPIRRPLSETLDWARDRALVTSLAHPFRWTHGVGGRIALSAPSSAIETMNGHNREVPNARAALLASRRGIGETGGSDAHTRSDIGRAWTEFREDMVDIPDLLSEIPRGHTRALGQSRTASEGVRLALQSGLRRVARGFRSI
ncbi:MAG: PHP domain-containing protein [Thermoplasmata archaeon]|nr:PHP domain-containing protein [Thermoplasmata archaeon]MCI4359798.1 PHP domain-containing protein [Thermoplasmata archaeon]